MKAVIVRILFDEESDKYEFKDLCAFIHHGINEFNHTFDEEMKWRMEVGELNENEKRIAKENYLDLYVPKSHTEKD